ncbi:MAG: cation diffusion facilitator family transporter [Candidatus Bathyarchaeia archaeon]
MKTRILMADTGTEKKINAIKYSMLSILSVFIVESSLGLVVGSLAILSDGFHALFDFTSMLILFISIRTSSKPPDENHMYGHEKFEYVGGLIGGVMLIILAVAIALEAISKMIVGKLYVNIDLSLVGYAALAYTFLIDLARMFILGPKFCEGALVIKTAFYHAFSDLCSTLIALFGFWFSSHGVYYGDSVASLALSAALIYLSVKLVWNNVMELSDIAPKWAVVKIEEQIKEASGGLFTYENLRVRKVGNKFFVRATLKVPDYMGLEEAHNVTTKIEEGISRILKDVDISFHIEPSGVEGLTTREFIRRVASSVKEVIDVHDVNIACRDGKTYVSLHIRIDPKKPLNKAHEVAERVEKAICTSMKGVENIFVHIEPSTIEPDRGSMISDEDIDRIVQSIIEERYGDKVEIKRVVTYLAEGRRQVNIECTFDESASVEEAHKLALEIENEIGRRLSETAVTVHMEPSKGRS